MSCAKPTQERGSIAVEHAAYVHQLPEDDNAVQGNRDWLKHYDIALEDYRVQCEVEDCFLPAQFYMLHRCCNKVFLGCPQHCREASQYLLDMNARNINVHCGWCHETLPPMKYMTAPQTLELK